MTRISHKIMICCLGLLGISISATSCYRTQRIPIHPAMREAIQKWEGHRSERESDEAFRLSGWDCGIQSNQRLLATVQKECYPGDYRDGSAKQLILRGESALPDITHAFLDESIKDESDYYHNILEEMMEWIPSARRDEAFIEDLQLHLVNPSRYVIHDHVGRMMMSLAENNCRRAVPVLHEYVTTGSNDLTTDRCTREIENAANARIALSALGEPFLRRDGAARLLVDQGFSWDNDLVAPEELRAIIIAMLNHELIAPRGKARVNKIEKSTNGDLIVLGNYEGFMYGNWKWRLTLTPNRNNTRPVFFSMVGGDLAGVFYAGVIEKRNGQWLVIRWNLCGMS